MCLSTLVGFLQEHEYQNFLIYFWTEDAQRHVFSDTVKFISSKSKVGMYLVN